MTQPQYFPDGARLPDGVRQSTSAPGERMLAISTTFPGIHRANHLGGEAYSYYYVYRAFSSLLERWARVNEVPNPESRLDFAIRSARVKGAEPVHLSFLPLHFMYLTTEAPNVAFPFWEFPDIPDRDFGNNPRNNWVRIANNLSLILTASSFTRNAFLAAGVRAPIYVTPVPIQADYFNVPPWQPRQSVVLDCPYYRWVPIAEAEDLPSLVLPAQSNDLKSMMRYTYKRALRPLLPQGIHQYLAKLSQPPASPKKEVIPPPPIQEKLVLSGITFVSIFNPLDQRKNWHDIISAFLLSLKDRQNATLILKIVVSPSLEASALEEVYRYYRELGLEHRCNLILITAYLSDEQMIDLTRASTYYVNASRAEGACLPLQNFMAAERPGIAPSHTAMADYFHPEVGFVIASSPEPTCWPHDPTRRCTTTRHRLVWQSLHDQYRAAYETACEDRARYESLGSASRKAMNEFASAERIWPRLAAALDEAQRANSSGWFSRDLQRKAS